ncbi:hypothetical protein V2J09_012979, partial [Rumex salicifolius]
TTQTQIIKPDIISCTLKPNTLIAYLSLACLPKQKKLKHLPLILLKFHALFLGLHNMQNHQDTNFVLSTDAKPRLKWTPELHQRFVKATIQLGGIHKATPKSLMRVMDVPGLTLYHLKSHLQKYRLGKNHLVEAINDSNQQDCKDSQGKPDLCSERTIDETTNEFHVAQAIQVQVEVQRKLYEQIEAQETLCAYTSSSIGAESARTELSQLVSMVTSGCQSPSFSELTEDSVVKGHKELMKIMEDEDADKLTSLDQLWMSGLSNEEILFKKRKLGSTISKDSKRQAKQRVDNGTLDLNRMYQDDQNLEPKIDLNSIGIEQFHGASLAP